MAMCEGTYALLAELRRFLSASRHDVIGGLFIQGAAFMTHPLLQNAQRQTASEVPTTYCG